MGLAAWPAGDPAAGGSGRAAGGRPGSGARSGVPLGAAALERAVRVAASLSLWVSGHLCSAAPRSSAPADAVPQSLRTGAARRYCSAC